MAVLYLTQQPSTITIRQGTTLSVTFTHSIKSSDTGLIVGPVDLTDYEFRFNLKKGSTIIQVTDQAILDTDEDSLLYNLPKMSSFIQITNAVEGKFKLYLSAIFTKKLVKGDWTFEIESISPENSVNTFLLGDFTVEQDIK